MRPQQRTAKRSAAVKTERPAKPLFATADPSRSTSWESRRSMKENAFKKLLVAGNVSEAATLLRTDPILKIADLLTKIQRGNSFLHAAITMPKSNSDEFVDLIIAHRHSLGATLDERNSDGFAPLHVAIKNNRLEASRKLILSGAYVNIQDKQGNTPLHLAILQNNEDAVRMLVELGANITVRNKKGFSAQGLAKRHLEELSGTESRPRGRFGRKQRPEKFPSATDASNPAPDPAEETKQVEEREENAEDAQQSDRDEFSPHSRPVVRNWGKSVEDEEIPPAAVHSWSSQAPDENWEAEPAVDIWGNPDDTPAGSSWGADPSAHHDGSSEVRVVDMKEAYDDEEEEEAGELLTYSQYQARRDDQFDIFGTPLRKAVDHKEERPERHEDEPQDEDEDDDHLELHGLFSLSSSESESARPEKERKIRRAEKRARKLAQKDADRQARVAREALKQPPTKTSHGTQKQQASESAEIRSDDEQDVGDLFASTSSSVTASTNTARDPASLLASEDSLFSSTLIPAPSTEAEAEPTTVDDTPVSVALRILRWLRNHAQVTGKRQQKFFDAIKNSTSPSALSHNPEIWINSVQPQKNESALLCAIKYAPATVVEFIIHELGADPRISNIMNESLLHHAVKRADPRIVSLLLATGANIFVRNSRGDTPLELALQSSAGSNWEIVSALLEAMLERPAVAHLQKLSQSICWCLREAVKRGSIDLVRQIMVSGAISLSAASTGAGWTPLHLAVKYDQLAIAELLLESSDKKVVNAKTSDGFSALHMAIENAKEHGESRLNMLHLLLRHGADPNAAIKSGITALHMASRHGLLQCATALLQAGAKPDVWHERLRTPLWLAFKDSRSELCQALVKSGATDLRGKVTYLTGEPLLFESIRRADSNLVRAMLIDQRWEFDPLWKHPKTGMNITNLAVMKELDADVVSVICNRYLEVTRKKPAVVESDVNSFYSSSAVEEPKEKASETENVNIPARGPLHTAVLVGSEVMVDLLCSLGFDCNQEDRKGISPISLSLIHQKTPLLRLMAGKYGGLLSFAPVERSRRKPSAQILVELGLSQRDLLQIYLEQKPADAASALWFAIDQNRLDTARWLLHSLHTDPNTAFGQLKRTILHHVVQKGDLEAVKLLLFRPDDSAASLITDVNCQDAHGWSPLHIAIQQKRTDIALLILDEPNVDVALEDDRKFTPLHLALAVPHMTDVVEKILSLRRNEMRVDLDNNYGKNALFYALRRRHWEIAAKLLSISGTVSLSNNAAKIGNSGWSLLHVAAVNGFVDIVHELGRGADWRTLNAQEGRGWTPLHLAVRHLHADVVEALLRYGASVNVANHKLWNPIHTLVASAHFEELKKESPETYERADRILNLLLNTDGSFNAAIAPNQNKNTPLDVAISFENVGAATRLLDRGIVHSRSFDFVNFKGLPLHKAISRLSVPTIQILLHKMKDLPEQRRVEIVNEPRGRSEWPPIFAAVHETWNSTELLSVLLQNGANVFQRDANKQNVLHLIAQKGSSDYARVLLKELGEKTVKELMKRRQYEGLTPLQVARGWIKRYLRRAFLQTYRRSAEDKYFCKPDKNKARRKKIQTRRDWAKHIAFEKQDYLANRRDF